MRKLGMILVMLLLIFTSSACGSKKSGQSQIGNGAAADQNLSMNQMDAREIENKGTASKPEAEIPYDEGRKIIYNANSFIEVKNLNEAHEAINKKIKEVNGYVASSNIMENSSQIVARIPSGSLDGFLDYLKTIGDIKSQNRSTQDITEQYTDTVSRIKNLKAQEEQLLAIMKKANTIEEVLKVQSELSKVRGDIEVFEGRIKMWDKLIDFSTVTIHLNKVQVIGDKDTKIKFISWDQITRAMSNGFKWTLNLVISFISGVIIFIVSAIPVVPFVVLGVWVIAVYRKKRKKDIPQ